MEKYLFATSTSFTFPQNFRKIALEFLRNDIKILYQFLTFSLKFCQYYLKIYSELPLVMWKLSSEFFPVFSKFSYIVDHNFFFLTFSQNLPKFKKNSSKFSWNLRQQFFKKSIKVSHSF